MQSFAIKQCILPQSVEQALSFQKCIKSSEVICYDDLGAEAIRKIYVEDFPVIVVIDSEGNNLYETSIKEFIKI